MIQKKYATVATRAGLCLLAMSLLLLLAACGGSSGTTSATPTDTPTTAPTVAPTPTTAPTTAPADTPTTAPASGGNSVTISNFAFSPATLTVKVGTKVTWTNNDSVAHTATADQGAFNSPTLETGSTYSFTFTKAGTYTYHCAIHSYMTATIVVQ